MDRNLYIIIHLQKMKIQFFSTFLKLKRCQIFSRINLKWFFTFVFILSENCLLLGIFWLENYYITMNKSTVLFRLRNSFFEFDVYVITMQPKLSSNHVCEIFDDSRRNKQFTSLKPHSIYTSESKQVWQREKDENGQNTAKHIETYSFFSQSLGLLFMRLK